MKTTKYILIAFFLFTCCNKNDDNTSNSSFNVKTLLEDTQSLQIAPNINHFVSQITLLNTSVENYLTAGTEDLLTIARTNWKNSALAYAKIYAYNIGDVRDQYMHQALYNWPTLPSALENFITNNTEITEEIISNLSPQVKTLSAIEYLLFAEDLQTVNTLFLNSEKRRNYLKFTSLELKSQAERLQNIWSASGQNYSYAFTNNNETGINSSFNKLYNGLYNLIDTAKITKIGKPAGLENSSNTNPELTQAYFSNTSLAILSANIDSVKDTYFNSNGKSIANYVFSITNNNELNDTISLKINEVQTAINAISVPLFTAINSEHDKVTILHEKLNELGVLFSVDVRSILSIILTSTDNDGD